MLCGEALKQQHSHRKKVGTKAAAVWKADLGHPTEPQHHEGCRNTAVNTEPQASASGENAEPDAFFRGERPQRTGIVILGKRLECNIPSSC